MNRTIQKNIFTKRTLKICINPYFINRKYDKLYYHFHENSNFKYITTKQNEIITKNTLVTNIYYDNFKNTQYNVNYSYYTPINGIIEYINYDLLNTMNTLLSNYYYIDDKYIDDKEYIIDNLCLCSIKII